MMMQNDTLSQKAMRGGAAGAFSAASASGCSARLGGAIRVAVAGGLLVWAPDGRLRLAEQAYLIANQVFTRFLAG